MATLTSERGSAAGLTWRHVPILAAAIALGLGSLFALRVIVRPIAILLLAITLGEALSPLVDRLERRLGRMSAVALIYAALFILAALMFWLIVPTLGRQVQEIGDRLPELVGRARSWLARFDQVAGGNLVEAATARLAGVGGALVALPLRLLSSILELLLVIFLSIYWLLGTPTLRRFVLSLVAPGSRARVGAVLSDMGAAMGGYVRGAAINAVVMGVLAWIGLVAIGVDYALVLGLLTMLGEPVPYVGPIVAGAVVALVALLQSPTKALLAVGLYTALQQVEGHLLTPNIMSKQTHTSQALVIFALLAGAAVGGLLGALVAIPVAGALQVFTVEVLAPAIRRRSGARTGSAAAG